MPSETISFIGGGNMSLAIMRGLVDGGFAASSILVAEPSEQQRERLHRAFPDTVVEADNTRVAGRADTLLLAVKPQVLPEVCRELAATVQASKPLIVTIAAGVRSTDIDAWLGGGLAVVRVMPNQPALLGKGVSGLYANPRTSPGDRARARRILEAVGAVLDFDREADIDAVTAVSGSGPAYFFLLIDMLIEAAERFGLDGDSAARLAVATASGAAALAAAADEPMDKLIARVRSPGGTTAAALDSLESDGVRDIFARALTAARDRAVTLADIARENRDNNQDKNSD